MMAPHCMMQNQINCGRIRTRSPCTEELLGRREKEATRAFAPDPRWEAHDAAALLRMDEDAFAAYAAGSPIQRPGRRGMARNASIVLGNSADKRHLPVLREAAVEDADEGVREAARWAVARLEQG